MVVGSILIGSLGDYHDHFFFVNDYRTWRGALHLPYKLSSVSYTHLTLPTNREV